MRYSWSAYLYDSTIWNSLGQTEAIFCGDSLFRTPFSGLWINNRPLDDRSVWSYLYTHVICSHLYDRLCEYFWYYKLLALSTGGHYMNNMIIFHILFDTAIACLMNFVVWAIYETQYGSLDEKIPVNVESVVTVVSTMAWQRCGSVGTLFSISVVARSTLLAEIIHSTRATCVRNC